MRHSRIRNSKRMNIRNRESAKQLLPRKQTNDPGSIKIRELRNRLQLYIRQLHREPRKQRNELPQFLIRKHLGKRYQTPS